MKKLISIIIVVCLATACLTGCNEKEKDKKSSSKGKKEVTTTVVTTTSPTTSTTKPNNSSDPDPIIEDKYSVRKFFKSFKEFDEKTGLVSSSAKDLEDKILDVSKFGISDLDGKTIKSEIANKDNLKTLYRVDSENTKELDVNDDAYGFEHIISGDDNGYFIVLGTNSISKNDVEPYAFINTKITYYSLVFEFSDNNYVIVPIIGGNDDIGYWAMKPALETMGVEYPDMATLNISTPKTPTNPTPTTPTPPSGTIGEITIVTTNVSQFEYGYTTVDFNLTNGINASIYLDDVIVTFNGKDISDDSIIFIEAKKGETVEDDFFVPVEIKSGDTLTISGTIINDDTFETLGTITLPMTFK